MRIIKIYLTIAYNFLINFRFKNVFVHSVFFYRYKPLLYVKVLCTNLARVIEVSSAF